MIAFALFFICKQDSISVTQVQDLKVCVPVGPQLLMQEFYKLGCLDFLGSGLYERQPAAFHVLEAVIFGPN